ncbi:MAG: BrnA antitoxin family protein [Hyphomicrobiales bacterium]
MTGNKKGLDPDWTDPDDAPDLSSPYWAAKMDKATVSRGRPRLVHPKVSTTLRLDADVLEKFKAQGPRWQTRINDALREWLKKAG